MRMGKSTKWDQPDEFDCIDPELGAELWRLADPECSNQWRERLATHLKFCADCRMRQALDGSLVAGLQSGNLRLTRRRRWLDRAPLWTFSASAASLAAGLALLILLPAVAPDTGQHLRGSNSPGIEQPVPEDVLLSRRPTLRWTPLPGATSYQVQVEAVGGGYEWSEKTRLPFATVPPSKELPPDTRFRVRVVAKPAHVVPSGFLGSSFQTGGLFSWLGHRARHGAGSGRLLGMAGLLGLLLGVVELVYRGRTA